MNYLESRCIFTEPPITEEYQWLPDLHRKHVLVVGGSRGIGAEVARMAKHQGALVTTVSRHYQPTPYSDAHLVADCANPYEIRRVWQSVGVTDMVFNNVGIYEQGTLVGTNSERWDEVINANLTSMFHLTRHALMGLASGGVMVNMAYRPTLEKYHSWATYTLSKQGVITLTQAAAEEAERDIRAYAICPSRVDTKFREDLFPGEPKEQRLSAEDTATAIMYLANRSMPNGTYVWIKQLYG